MFHTPINSINPPVKSESIDYVWEQPPKFSNISAPFTSANASCITNNGTVAVTLFSGTAQGAITSNGTNWQLVALPVSDTWSSITYGNGIFVAVSSTTTNVISSPDGMTWALATSVLTGAVNIAYGNSTFVAIQYGNSVGATSPNGINWTLMSMPSSQAWQALTFGNGIFVCCAFDTTIAAYSSNGTTWTTSTMTTTSQWWSITYGGGLFVCVSNGAATINTSPDGINWTAQAWDNDDYTSICYGNGMFMACATSGDNEFSTNGIANTYGTTLSYTGASGITYLPTSGLFIIVFSTGVLSVSSPTASVWTANNYAQQYACGAYGNSTYVILSNNNSNAFISSTGSTWKQIPLPVSQIWSSIIWGGRIFVAFPVTGTTGMVSLNGVEWTLITLPTTLTAGACIAYGNGRFLATGATAAQAMYSTDGIEWYARSQVATGVSVNTFGNNLFAGITTGTSVCSSTGTPQNAFPRAGAMPSSTTWGCIAYGRGVFVAMNTTTAGAVSVDGLFWNPVTLPVSAVWSNLQFVFGSFMAVATAGSTMLLSYDGKSWKSYAMPFAAAYVQIVVGKNNIVVIGSDGTLLTSQDFNGSRYGLLM